ncbi:hypothetical protein EA796_05525 [Pseudomonas sp. AOB-7]|nr:hypothetical protein EA796_05525 [Pseudomonas sp. AOB-7]
MGLTLVKLGEEARLDLATFDLSGPSRARLRQACSRLARLDRRSSHGMRCRRRCRSSSFHRLPTGCSACFGNAFRLLAERAAGMVAQPQ